MHGFDLTIGITAPTLQLIILALLFRRRLVDRFPLFCAYTSYSILASVARLWIIDRPRPFFVLYWTTEIVYGFLSLLAVYEVFKSEGSMRCATRGWLGVLPQITFAVV